MLNKSEDLQFINFSLICSIVLKTFSISLGKLEINKVSSIINFILQLDSFLYLGTLSRNFSIFTIARNISKILQTLISKSIMKDASYKLKKNKKLCFF